MSVLGLFTLLITPLVYFVIVLSVLRLFVAFDYFIGIFGHCIVRASAIYGFWLLLWYILVIVLSVRRQFTASDYFFGIFWLLYIRTSSIYGFWLLLWYILVIILSVLRVFTASDNCFGIFWSLYCLYFVYLRLLITPLVSFGHCIVRTSSIYGFWLSLWYLLVIVLSVLRLFTASDYSFGIFWSLYCHYVVYLRFWLLLWYILVIVFSLRRLFTASNYLFGIICPLYCPYFVNLRLLITSLVYFVIVFPSFVYLRLLITPLVYFGHYIVCTSSIYSFWLLLWYILVIVLSLRRLFTASDYSYGIFYTLYRPYFVNFRLLITSLVYFGHYIVCTSFIYGFWLLHWYIMVIVLSVLRLFTLLITPLVYFVIVLSVRRLFTAYDYFFVIF